MALKINKMVTTVFGIVFALALLPTAIDEVAAFAVAYPEWATIIGLVSLALVFGLVYTAMQGSGVATGA